MKEIEFRSRCPIASALDLFGDKWSLLIIRDLSSSDKRTFKDFAGAPEKISTARLSDRLRKLESLGIISKERHPTNKKVYLYSLLPKGRDLVPIVVEYILWSYKHLNEHVSESSKQLAEELLSNKKSVLDKFMMGSQLA